MTILDAFFSLGRDVNKVRGKSPDIETEEGVVSEKFPELELKMPNDDIIKLTTKWKKTWIESEVYSEWFKHSKENEEYWIGKQHSLPRAGKTRPLIDNLMFE